MGIRNYLIEGVSGTGKTSVAEELERRGYHVIHGDRALAYRGDPKTGEPLDGLAPASEADSVMWVHKHWIWNVDKVKSLIADRRDASTFFCGGSRNLRHFIDLFDAIFVLGVDLDTLNRRLAAPPQDEFGAKPNERELIRRLHATQEDTPAGGITIDATAPLDRVVDAILDKCGEVRE
jgi:thymidylate kinase